MKLTDVEREERKKRKAEQGEKLAAIEKKAVRIYKAISVLQELGEKEKEVQQCIEILTKKVEQLESVSAQLIKARFAELKKANQG